jgi:hypothetical protein
LLTKWLSSQPCRSKWQWCRKRSMKMQMLVLLSPTLLLMAWSRLILVVRFTLQISWQTRWTRTDSPLPFILLFYKYQTFQVSNNHHGLSHFSPIPFDQFQSLSFCFEVGFNTSTLTWSTKSITNISWLLIQALQILPFHSVNLILISDKTEYLYYAFCAHGRILRNHFLTISHFSQQKFRPLFIFFLQNLSEKE